jgi:hypothetical protein
MRGLRQEVGRMWRVINHIQTRLDGGAS